MSKNEMVERIEENIKRLYNPMLLCKGKAELVGKTEAKKTRDDVEHSCTISIIASVDTLKMVGMVDENTAWDMMYDLGSRVHNWICSFE